MKVRTKKMKKMFASLVVGAALGVVFVTGGTDAHASEADGVWTPRTVDQIKADIAKAKDNQYTIVWGDTLSGISQATNITVQKLADINKIANVDLIYAGNTLVFDGNVVTAKNDKGETVAQTVVQPQDKNDANKPVGKQAPEKAQGTTASSQSQNKQGTPATSGKTATSSQGTSAAVSGTNGSQTGTIGSVEGTTTSSGKVETPAQPSKPATPSQPTQPSKPAEKPSTGGEQGGSTTIPVIDPSTVTDQEPVPVMIGNSGKVFNSRDEAEAYGWQEIKDENSKWYGYGFTFYDLVNKNNDPINKFSVDFYEADQ